MSLDLNDVQGNILKAFGHFKLPHARYLILQIIDPECGRKFVAELFPMITSVASWDNNNPARVTTNLAMSYEGLKALGVPRKSLASFPEEFSGGMQARKMILGDEGVSGPENWDPVWDNDDNIHMWLSINGRTPEDIEKRYEEITRIMSECGHGEDSPGVIALDGHIGEGGKSYPYQDAAALTDEQGHLTRKEHFGYDDGISDPFFQGCDSPEVYKIGGGKPVRKDGDNPDPTTADAWHALETGEFILGYKDESSELPIAPIPHDLSKNGSFMVYRKLHENVHSFNSYLENMGKDYPDGEEALAAKFVGRWKNGAPLATFPTEKEAKAFGDRYRTAQIKVLQDQQDPSKSVAEKEANLKVYQELDKQLRAFNYNHDISGGRCPVGSHIRRTNPRGALEFGNEDAFETPGALTDRRRILRRGLPYGKYDSASKSDKGNHGIIFMAINASIKRQFEFVQQQWVNYGNDFKLANDRDPILGHQPVDENGNPQGRAVIEGEKGKRPPFLCGNLPSFVETRGGEYFFIPSLTALQLIARGIVDPT